MCEYISWKAMGEDVFFLQDGDLKGKKFDDYKKFNANWERDIYGHGAIDYFYPDLKGKGTHEECVDFSTPKNFPDEIVRAVKDCKMMGFGVRPEGLLNEAAQDEYDKVRIEYGKICSAARAEREKVCDVAHVECNKICSAARAEYEKIYSAAQDEYVKVHGIVPAKYEKVCDVAHVERNKIYSAARDEYEKICDAAQDEYVKVRDIIQAECNKICNVMFWKLFGVKKNRNPLWK